jgi:hypothetical protein
MNKKILSLLGISILVIGCGSVDNPFSEPNTSNVNKGTAFYIDSAVEGVTAQCRSTVSTTDKDGAFTYEVGEKCYFSIGNILLSEHSGITQNKMVLEDDIAVAQFLQSLDNDNYALNGIKITPATTNLLISNGINSVPQTESELAEIITMLQQSNIGFGGDVVDKVDAQAHIDWTKKVINNIPYFETHLQKEKI